MSVFFENIDSENIAVQLYAEPQDGEKPEIYEMNRDEQINEPEKGYYYSVHLPARRNISDYTPRVVAAFDGAASPLEANQILWKD